MAIYSVTKVQREALIELYIGYFNRAPEASGLDYWTQQLISGLNAGKNESAVLTSIANQFYDAGLYYGYYPANLSVQDFIKISYANALGRESVDKGGMDYWTQALESGSVSRGEFVQTLITAAKAYAEDPEWGWVTTYMENRVAVADHFAKNTDGLSGVEAMNAGIKALSVVTAAAAQAGQTPAQALEAAQGINGRTFTLTEASVTVNGSNKVLIDNTTTETSTIVTLLDPIVQKKTYWISADGGGAAPLSDLVSLIEGALGSYLDDSFADIGVALNLFNTSLDNIAGITLAGAGDQVQGDEPNTLGGGGVGGAGGNATDAATGGAGGSSETNIVYNEGSDKEGDYTGNYEMTVTMADGTAYTAVLQLSESQLNFIKGLLFDANGNTRLEEREVEVYSYMPLLARDPETGELIPVTPSSVAPEDSYGAYKVVIDYSTTGPDFLPVMVKAYDFRVVTEATKNPDVVVETPTTETVLVPIVLTPSLNNGATVEPYKPFTTSGNDVIVAGRMELLHQAYIDGGAGYNILEVDAKGTYAQPKALLNIQEVRIQDMPNVYTTDTGAGNGYLGNSSYGQPASLDVATATGIPASVFKPLIDASDANTYVSISSLNVKVNGSPAAWVPDGYYTAAQLASAINVIAGQTIATVNDAGAIVITSSDAAAQIYFGGNQSGALGLSNIAFSGELPEPLTGSVLDLTRAADIEKLVITKGDNNYLSTTDFAPEMGDLTVVGVRNGATLRVEGGFTNDVHVFYGEGRSDDAPIKVELLVGTMTGNINVNHNSNALHLVSLGGAANTFGSTDLGNGTMTNLVISGNARLDIFGDLASTFSNTTPVSIDARQNTKGVSLVLTESDKVSFTGSVGNDHFDVNTGSEEGNYVNISDVAGNNKYHVTTYNAEILVTGSGNNRIEVAAQGDADINVGNGQQYITVNAPGVAVGEGDVNITAGNGNSHFLVTNSINTELVTGNGNSTIAVTAQKAATITNGSGNNTVSITANNTTLTAGDGSSQVEVNGSGTLARAEVTLGDGDSNVEVSDVVQAAITTGDGKGNIFVGLDDDSTAEEVSITTGDGNKDIQVVATDSVAITAGNGQNDIEVEGNAGQVSVVTGNGGNFINVAADKISVTTGTGADQIQVEGREISVTAAGSGNTITVVGTDNDYTDTSDGALIQINAGANSVVKLGAADDEFLGATTLTAKEGSSIAGTNVTLYVDTVADLRATELSGITKIILDDDNATYSNSNPSNTDGDKAKLTLLDSQLTQLVSNGLTIGVEGSIFNTSAHIKIIVTANLDVTKGAWATMLSSLPASVDLQFEINDGATLKITAQQLHTKVLQGGIVITNDGNTDQVSGKVHITNAGLNFDPFNNNDQVRTVIEGTTYLGGSLSDADFVKSTVTPEQKLDGIQRAEWGFNVLVDRTLNGYNRPADAQTYSRLTIDTDEQGGEVGPFATLETFLRIIGDEDMEFTPMTGGVDEWGAPTQGGTAIALGVDNGVPTNAYMVDFSKANGEITNLTLANFENANAIYGNGDAGTPARVNVEIAGDLDESGLNDARVASSTAGLVSSGVQAYVVTKIDTENDAAEFWTSRVTQDLDTLGLRGNYGKTVTFGNTERGVDFLLEVAYDKFDGYAVGSVVADFARTGADAVVNVVGLQALPAGEVQKVKSIDVTDADALNINVTGGNTVLQSLVGSSVESLSLKASANLSISTDLMENVDNVDASGVTGTLTMTIAEPADGLVFVGAKGATSLTIENADEGAIDSITGVGKISLTVGDDTGSDTVDLTQTTLSNITSVKLLNGSVLSLTMDQAETIGASKFAVGTGDSATLNLDGLSDQVFAIANYDTVGALAITITLADDEEVTLNAATDLTDIASLAIPAGTTLYLTAEQFQQLNGAGTLTGAGSVVITDMTQADVGGAAPYFSLANVDIDGTITLVMAENVDLSAANITGVNTIVFTGQLTLGDITQGDGVAITGGANSTLVFKDTTTTSDESIDASGFDVTFLKHTNTLTRGDAANTNIDEIFSGLATTITKVVYNGEGWVNAVDQTVIIEAGTTVFSDLVYNKVESDVELQDFTINMTGGVAIDGDLRLPTGDKKEGEQFLIRDYLQTLTINSTGTAANLLTGETANIIDGDVSTIGVGGEQDNNLLDVTINATQALTITGDLVFNSNVGDDNGGDGMTVNDNEEATATVTVTGTANVNLGSINTNDEDVVGLNVVNTGSGTVTVTVNSGKINSEDKLSFTATTTGDVQLVVISVVDLSDDVLTAVSKITITEGSTLTLSQAQFDAIGAENIVSADGALHLNAVNSAFDASTVDADIDVGILTLAGSMDFAATDSDLTDVDTIVVPEGATLTLSAAQYQQLLNNGSIIGTEGTTEYTVNITGLTQDDIDGGSFITSGITAGTITLSLAEDVNFSAEDVFENVSSITLADGQTMGLATGQQADGLVIDGGTNTTVNLMFDVETSIDASGYDVTTLRAFAESVSGTDVEVLINDLPSSVTLSLYEDPDQLGYVSDVYRKVVIEAGVQTTGYSAFNGADADSEVRTLTITFKGDAEESLGNINGHEGAEIDGDLVLDAFPSGNLIADKFSKLTLVSEGEGTSNAITGDITPLDSDEDGAKIDNNLLDVEIQAEANFTIGGTVYFNSTSAAKDEATLTVSGAGDVSIEQLSVSGEHIDTLTIDNNGGDLTVTGASPSIDAGSAQSIVLTGEGNITLGTEEGSEDFADGIVGSNLTSLDASGLEGDLYIENISGVDQEAFSFTSGTGVTTLTIHGQTIDGDEAETGWNIDLSNAGVGSELHLGANTFTSGALTIELGANTTLYIDEDTDLTALDLTIGQVKSIVVANGVTLTLTAAQADGLNIVGEDGDDSTGTVNVTELGDAAYDLSGIDASIAGTVTLEDADVTLAVDTDLGDFSISLVSLNDDNLSGQTIRFQSVEQAERVINVTDAEGDGDNSSNVVWLFEEIQAPVNTDGYGEHLGRLWIGQTLISNSSNVEQLFTSLPSSIVRIEFTSLEEVNFALASVGIDRTIELVSFTDLSTTGLVFSDADRYENVKTLTIKLGGSVETGDIELDNLIEDSEDPLELTPTGITFNTLTISSELALHEDHYLAPDLYKNNNDGRDLSGENVQPANLNIVGDIGVGEANGIDLLSVVLQTGSASTVGGGIGGSNGANLKVGTITFDSEDAASTASLTVTGANTTTVAALNTDDAQITGLSINNNGTGELSVTGVGTGAAVSSIDTLTIGGTGDVNLGGANNPGVSSSTLTSLDVNGSGDVDLGLIDSVSSANFTLDTTDNTGDVTVVFDKITSGAPSLAGDDEDTEADEGGVWTFVNGDDESSLNVTLTEDVVLGNGTINMTGVTLTIEGDVDFTTLMSLTLTNTTIDVPEGSTLTILAEDADGLTVTGGGLVTVKELEATPSADLSNIMTNDGDSGTVEAELDASGTPDLTGNLGIAHVTISGEGSVYIDLGDTLANYSLDTIADATFTVGADAILELRADQANNRTVDGEGITNIGDIGFGGTADFGAEPATVTFDDSYDEGDIIALLINGEFAYQYTVVSSADDVASIFKDKLDEVGGFEGEVTVSEGVLSINFSGTGTNEVDGGLVNDFGETNSLVIEQSVPPTPYENGYWFQQNIFYGGVNSAQVNIAVDTMSKLDSTDDLGAAGPNRVITIADDVYLFAEFSAVDGQYIAGQKGGLLVDDEQSNNAVVPITADLSNVSAGLITFVADAVVEDVTFPVLYGDPVTKYGDADALPPVVANPEFIVQTVLMTAAQANGQTIIGAENGTHGEVFAIDLGSAYTDLSNIDVGRATALVLADATLNPATKLGEFNITLNGEAIDLTLTAAQADGRAIEDAGDDSDSVTITSLEDTLDADLSRVDAQIETAYLDANGDVTLSAKLGSGMEVVVSDSETGGSNVVTFDGELSSASTTFTIADDDITLVFDADSTHDLTVQEAEGGVSDSEVIVNNVDGDAMDLSSIEADTMTANVAETNTLDSNSDLGEFNVVLAEGVNLTLNFDQMLEAGIDLGISDSLGEDDFMGTNGGDQEIVTVTDYEPETMIDTSLLHASVGMVLKVKSDGGTVLNPTTVTVNADTDFSGVNEIVIPAGVILVMTADQFQQISSGVITGDGTLNITDFDGSNADIDLSNVTANAGSIELAETQGIVTGSIHGSPSLESTLTVTNPIVLAVNAVIDNATGDKFKIVFTNDNQAITLSSETQADGRNVDGGENLNTFLVLGFSNDDAKDDDANMVATDFKVDHVYVLNQYLENEFAGVVPANIEAILNDLDSGIEVTIYDADTALEGNLVSPEAIDVVIRVINVEPDTHVDANLAFNDIRSDSEVTELTVNLYGNSVIEGDLRLPQNTDPMSLLPGNYVSLFEELSINSYNYSLGEDNASNMIDGSIFANNTMDGAESQVERFTIDFAGVSIAGAEEQLEFAGVVVDLDNGDDGEDVATALADAINRAFGVSDQPLWYATADGTSVTFTALAAGDVTDVTLSDFRFTENDANTAFDSVMSDDDLVIDQQGSFEGAENNLLLVNIHAEHDLVITGAIEFSYVAGSSEIDDTSDDTATAVLNLSGSDDITIGSLNTEDDHISVLVINNTNTGTVTIPGTSPGAAVGDTGELIINHNTTGDMIFGTSDDLDKPGVAGDDLTLIDVTGSDGDGMLDLGVIALVDGDDFTIDSTGFDGTLNAIIRADMNEGGEWTFDNGDSDSIGEFNLTFVGTSDADAFGDDEVYATNMSTGTLILNNVNVTIEGELDWTQMDVTIGAGTTITVDAGSTLTLTVDQALALEGDIVGAGTIIITGDGTDADPVTLGENLRTVGIDLSAITLNLGEDDDGIFAITLPGALVDGSDAGQDVLGTDNSDSITGSEQDDTISGGLMNDTIVGGGGSDDLYGNDGEDMFAFDSVEDLAMVTIDGGSDDDTIALTGSGDRDISDSDLNGTSVEILDMQSDGDDDISLGVNANAMGIASVYGGEGEDTLTLEDPAGHTLTLVSVESLAGSSGEDTIIADNDLSAADLGADDDTLTFTEGGVDVDVLGGEDTDTVYLSGSDGDVNTLDISGVEFAYGSAGSDSITVEEDGGATYIDGSDGDDLITGDTDADTLIGGNGNDTIDGYGGSDSIDAGAGDDIVFYSAGTVYANGGSDTDTLTAEDASEGVDLDMSDLGVYSNFENLIGSDHSDSLTGDDGNNTINGGAGDDTIVGGGGSDDLDGGDDNDTVSYAGSAAAVTVDLGAGTASGGDADGDTLSNFENVIGSDYSDSLIGGSDDNIIAGGTGDDTIQGGIGDDTMTGGAGADLFVMSVSDDDADTDNILDWGSGDIISGTLGEDDQLNVIFGESDKEEQGAPTTVDGIATGEESVDEITGTSNVSDIDTDSFLITTLVAGEVLYLNSDGELESTGTNPATFSDGAYDFTWEVPATGSLAQKVDALVTAYNTQFGGTPMGATFTSLSGPFTITIAGATDLNFAIDDELNDYVGPDLSDATVTFAESYDVGDVITLTVDGEEHTHTVATGATSGQDVAEIFAAMINSDDSTETGTASVSDDVLTIENEGPNGFTVTASITEITGLMFDGSQVAAGNNSRFGVLGSSGDDTIIGGAYDDTIYGGDGDDKITGWGGSDSLFGEDGNDEFIFNSSDDLSGVTMNGGSGDDSIVMTSDADLILTDADFAGESVETLVLGDGSNDVTLGYKANDLGIATVVGGEGEDEVTLTDDVDGEPEAINLETGHRLTMTGVETVNGSFAADTLTADADLVVANLGSDDDSLTFTESGVIVTIDGEGGSDSVTLFGSDGDDNTVTMTGIETLTGSAGSDDVTADGSIENVDLSDGDDTLVMTGSLSDASPDNATVDGGAGEDSVTLFGTGSDVNYIELIGVETLTGSDSTDYVGADAALTYADLGGGEDVLYFTASGVLATVDGGDGSDAVMLFGSDGDDNTVSLLDVESVLGSAADDEVIFLQTVANAEIDGSDGDDTVRLFGSDTDVNSIEVTDVKTVYGSAGSDSITVAPDGGATYIDGSDGNDDITGDTEADTLLGGAGNDTIDGYGGSDSIDAGAGNDLVYYNLGTNANGGSDTDTLTAADSLVAVNIDLSNPGFFLNFENLIGSSSDDTLTGDSAINNIQGGAGDDTINGGGGSDSIFAGSDDDLVMYDALDTSVNGGDGNDTLSADDASSGVVIDLGDVSDAFDSFENLIGSDFSDELSGDSAANTINGGAGDDTIEGGAGSDSIDAGSDDDLVVYDALDTSVNGGDGFDTLSADDASSGVVIDLGDVSDAFDNFEILIGSDFSDDLTGDSAANTINGGDGNDTIDGGAGNDWIFAGSDADLVIYDALDTSVDGGDGIDTLSAALATAAVVIDLSHPAFDNFEILTGSGYSDDLLGDSADNTINGGAGNDTIDGGEGSDSIFAGSDDDLVMYDALDTSVNGGDGNDTLSADDASSGVVIDLGDVSDAFDSFENLIGSDFSDELSGDSAANTINGGAGDDTIEGGAGSDSIDAGSDDDLVVYDALDTSVNGGDGFDTLSADDAISGVVIDLGDVSDAFDNFEILIGSDFSDDLTGDNAANTINGGDGNDTIDGGAGNDWIFAGSDADLVIYDALDTSVNGGDGIDTLSAALATAAVVIDLSHPAFDNFEILTGSGYSDDLLGDSADNTINGGAGNDTIDGGEGSDSIFAGSDDDLVMYDALDTSVNGGEGTDTLSADEASSGVVIDLGDVSDAFDSFENLIGSDFSDDLSGDIGDNTISGGDGNDTIDGGQGADLLIGGSDADVFVFDSGDSYEGTFSGTGLSDGDIFTFSDDGVDIISNFSSDDGDSIDLSGHVNFSDGALGVTTDSYDYVRGDLSNDGQSFVASGAGEDTLLIINQGGTKDWVVLTGFVNGTDTAFGTDFQLPV